MKRFAIKREEAGSCISEIIFSHRREFIKKTNPLEGFMEEKPKRLRDC